jgi:hypothetical protein
MTARSMGGTNMSHRTSRQDRARQEIERAWGDVPVVDAKAPLRVLITQEDLDGAIADDPALCLFARACMRTFHSRKVLFFREVAFVELPDELGHLRVERFIMGQAMRDVIASFDRGEPIIPEAGFTLGPPSRSDTLEAKRRQNRKARAKSRERQRRRTERNRAERERRAAGLGDDAGPESDAPSEAPVRSKFAPFREDPVLVDARTRDGTGVVNWLRKRAGKRRRSAAALGSESRPR